MRSILESAFYALTNHDKEKSDALFREYMIERSRQIHESIRTTGSVDINELLKEDETPVPVDVFSSEVKVELIDQAPEAFLIISNGENFDVLGIVSAEEAEVAAKTVSSLDGGEARVATKDELVSLLGEESAAIVGGLTASISATSVGELFADGVEAFNSDDLPTSVVAINVSADVAEDADEESTESDVEPQTSEEEQRLATIGSDLTALVKDFDDEIEKNTLGEGFVDRLAIVDATTKDGVDSLGEPVAVNKVTGVATGGVKAAPVAMKGSVHAGYDLEKAPEAIAVSDVKNSLAKADQDHTPAAAGEPADAMLNTFGGAEEQVGLFDKKI